MNREEYKALASQTIDQIASKLDEVKAQRAALSEQAQSTFDEVVAELERQKAELQLQRDQLQHATDDQLADVKKAFSSAGDSFKEGFSALAQLFKS